jgi:phospholipase C
MNRLFPWALAALCVAAPASAQISSFEHIILVVQENRTPDNLFDGLCTTPSACSAQPGPKQYNIQTTGWRDNTSPTGTTNPTAVQFGLNYDIQHRHAAFVAMCDLNATGACAMDGAAHEVCVHGPCPTRAAFGY